MTGTSLPPSTRKRTLLTTTLLSLMLGAGANGAQAQYVWRDAKGIQHWSDRPPPTAVPAGRIIRSPAGAPATAAGASGAPESSDARPVASATVEERETAFQQRRKEALAAQNKAANDASDQAALAANCQAARQNQRALDDGLRLNSYDEAGNRTIMDDAQRAELAKKTQKVLAGCK